MYAVIATGGKQYRISPGDRLHVELLRQEEKEAVVLGDVLLFKNEESIQVGQPTLDDVQVQARILGQDRGPKVINFKYKRRKNYRRKVGHRQDYTHVEIVSIEAPGKKNKAAKAPKESAIEESASKESKPKKAATKKPAKADA